MRVIQFIVLLTILLSACKGNKVVPIQQTSIQIDSSIRLMQTASGQLSPSAEAVIGDRLFQVVVRGKDTVFMSTRDLNFKTPEGYEVGTYFSDLPNTLKKNVSLETGFSYSVSLKSGWRLGFCEGATCTDHKPSDTSRVDFIYKKQ